MTKTCGKKQGRNPVFGFGVDFRALAEQVIDDRKMPVVGGVHQWWPAVKINFRTRFDELLHIPFSTIKCGQAEGRLTVPVADIEARLVLEQEVDQFGHVAHHALHEQGIAEAIHGIDVHAALDERHGTGAVTPDDGFFHVLINTGMGPATEQ